MYSVIGVHGDQEITIYNDTHLIETSKAISPKLTLRDNTAGSLEITLPKGNAGYDILEKMVSEIVVYKQEKVPGQGMIDVEIWCGRIISERKDFLNNRILTCEGALAYLNDTIQPIEEYSAESPLAESPLAGILNNHNSKSLKRFLINPASDIPEEFDTIYTKEETTLNNIQNLLLNKHGGHIRVRRNPGSLDEYIIDYNKDYPNINSQIIRFGENLIDFVQDWDMSNVVSAVLPRGASSEDTYIDVSDIDETDSPSGDKYVYNSYLMSRYGRIETSLDFQDIEEPQELYEKAVLYLEGIQEKIQMEEVTLEVSAVDLRYLGVDYESIKLLDKVRCLSPPHGVDKLLPVTELSIQLDRPENSTYVLGGRVSQTLTESQKKLDSDILDRINNIPITDEYGILQAAMTKSQALIDGATNGRITIERSVDPETGIRTENLIVSDGLTKDTSYRMWKWNWRGLGFYTRENLGHEWDINPANGIAIDMTGSISATSIQTGFMSADRIYGGYLASIDGNVTWDLNSGGKLTINKGDINLGLESGGYNFTVNNSGELYARRGMIGGFHITPNSIYNDVVELDDGGVSFTKYVASTEARTKLGYHGISHWYMDSDSFGMVMNTEKDIAFMAWGIRSDTLDPYSGIIAYYNKKLEIIKPEYNDDVRFYDSTSQIVDRVHNRRYIVYNSGSGTSTEYSVYKYEEPTDRFIRLEILDGGTRYDERPRRSFIERTTVENTVEIGCPVNFLSWPAKELWINTSTGGGVFEKNGVIYECFSGEFTVTRPGSNTRSMKFINGLLCESSI